MTNLIPARRRYRLSNEELRESAVALVRSAMEEQGLSRSRAATIVGQNLGFSRSAVIGWCEDAGVLASAESNEDRALAREIILTRQINRRLAAERLNAAED